MQPATPVSTMPSIHRTLTIESPSQNQHQRPRKRQRLSLSHHQPPPNNPTNPNRKMPTDIHSLAPETRKAIFKLALTHDSPFSIKGIYPEYHGRAATTTLTCKHLAATQLNQLFRSEALKIFLWREHVCRLSEFGLCG
jgi:hypothetical protein